MAATETQRRKSQTNVLHRDFTLPVIKRSGRQGMIIRCDGVDGNGEGGDRELRSTPPAPAMGIDYRRRVPRLGATEIGFIEDDGGLEELRKKLLGHLREAADRMKLDVPLIIPAAAVVSTAPEQAPFSSAVDAAIPWTLRTRRAPPAKAEERTPRMRSEERRKNTPQKFSVSLSKEEIEEDVYALTGSRPRRRPKKRARILQRQLDEIFPGLWLSEITPESYRIPD